MRTHAAEAQPPRGEGQEMGSNPKTPEPKPKGVEQSGFERPVGAEPEPDIASSDSPWSDDPPGSVTSEVGINP